MGKNALIVVDIQNDFVSGSLATDPEREYVKKTADWLSGAKKRYDHIVTTQDWHIEPGDHFESWPVHCEAGTEGADINEFIQAALYNTPHSAFLKGQYSDGYSGFEGVLSTDENVSLNQWLQSHDVSTVDIIGIATDHCVRATSVNAVEHGFTVNVLRDYVNGVDKGMSDRLLDRGFEELGINVK